MEKSKAKCANFVRTWKQLDILVSHLILQITVQISITQRGVNNFALSLSISLSSSREADRNHILDIN